MAQMIVIYKSPRDAAAFARHYFEVQVPLVRQLPGLRKYATSCGPVISLYGAAEAHFVATLQFDSLSDITAAFASECARARAAARGELVPHASDVEMFLFENQSLPITGAIP